MAGFHLEPLLECKHVIELCGREENADEDLGVSVRMPQFVLAELPTPGGYSLVTTPIVLGIV